MEMEKYENKIEFPARQNRPRLKEAATPSEIREHAIEIEIWQEGIGKVTETRNKHREEARRLQLLFKEDCLRELGIHDNLKADDAYELAWRHGHSDGFTSLYNYLSELAPLIRE